MTLLNSTVTGNVGLGSSKPLVGGIHDVHGEKGLTFISNTILSGNGPGSFADDCRVVQSLDGGNDGAAQCDVGAVEQFGETGSPSISIADRPEEELNSGLHLMRFTLNLSSASKEPVSVNFATLDGTATAGVDYFAASGNVTFGPGETSDGLFVAIIANTVPQDNRSFFVNLSNPGGATIEDGTAVGTIFDDDTVVAKLSVGIPLSSLPDTVRPPGGG